MANPTILDKDQFVVAYIPDFVYENQVISHSIFLSHMIKKGLILLHICPTKSHESQLLAAENSLKELQQKYQSQLHDITYCVLKGDSKKIINALPTMLGAVIVVMPVDAKASLKSPVNPNRVLRLFSECKIAYLTVQVPLTDIAIYNHILTTIDFKRESKEKLIWTSYFARFNKSQIHILYYDYKDEGLHQKWYNNMRFLHKFFSNLGLTFTPQIIPSNRSTFTDINAIKELEEQKEKDITQPLGILLSVTTQERDAIEWILGTQEQRSIKNSLKLPVLYLNPREDLYVLCD